MKSEPVRKNFDFRMKVDDSIRVSDEAIPGVYCDSDSGRCILEQERIWNAGDRRRTVRVTRAE